MHNSSVSLEPQPKNQAGRPQRWVISVFLIFALVMGFYALTAIEASHSNFAAVYDPSIREGRIAAQQEVLAGRADNAAKTYWTSTGIMLPLASKMSGAPEALYGENGIYDTLIYYSEMPKSHIATLSFHNLMGGLCMLFGAFQFWPAFRKRAPRWHRGFGMLYMVAAQVGMIAAMSYMVMTPLEKMYDTLTFTVGLWFLAIGVTLTLWLSIWHLWRKEYAQHQAYMALNYGLLLTAPFTRINWTWAANLFPNMPQGISNYVATAVLIPSCIFIGYALLCMNRWLQKERSTPNTKPTISPALQTAFTYTAIGLALLTITTQLWTALLQPGLAQSALAQQMLPATVIAHDTAVLGDGLSWSRLIHAISTLAAMLCGIRFLQITFLKPAAGSAIAARPWLAGLMVFALADGAVQLLWGWRYGAPSSATFAAGTPFLLNGSCSLLFALLLGWALRRGDQALAKEWGIFTMICVMALPAFYWVLAVLSVMPIADIYIQQGHAYRLGMYGGLFLCTAAVIYSAYGEVTQRRFAR